MQMEVGVTFQMRDTFAEIHRRATDGAMHVIAFVEQELGQKRPVLTRNTGY